ncbi:helix-turn-helix domain-containing protein [Phytomonospora endophytica]|uniref:Excisionase family DNA binding protein n=1 Tax=Phytomonospora endophytica TaxID=714109 RepID=A0A841FM88_9ACTN|nr:helix-turn-helix domain-containing protein [Phytomonospora endophytica]MBB6033719.1 excisionase family DNA binding protein [Phytomonospora endophytica]GIG64763.1 MerR family transcriptional regulator [Phytomonospora endophytica]
MSASLYSVDQVAELLGLHVKTVRNYVRDGKLKATRIGKQYRIARADLEKFTGTAAPSPVREEAARTRAVEVSAVVQVEAIGREEVSWLANTITGHSLGPPQGGERLRVENVYDEERAVLRIIVHGGPGRCAALLELVDTLLKERRHG